MSGEGVGAVFVRPDLPGSTRAECPPPRPDPHALNVAAALARQLYPGPVGEVLSERLTSTLALGFLGPDGLSARLAEWLTDEAHRRVATGGPVPGPSDRPCGPQESESHPRKNPDPQGRMERFRAAFGGAR